MSEYIKDSFNPTTFISESCKIVRIEESPWKTFCEEVDLSKAILVSDNDGYDGGRGYKYLGLEEFKYFWEKRTSLPKEFEDVINEEGKICFRGGFVTFENDPWAYNMCLLKRKSGELDWDLIGIDPFNLSEPKTGEYNAVI
ncbi:hypothetical protein ACFLY7_00070 [Patescibacteria group bacterium]